MKARISILVCCITFSIISVFFVGCSSDSEKQKVIEQHEQSVWEQMENDELVLDGKF